MLRDFCCSECKYCVTGFCPYQLFRSQNRIQHHGQRPGHFNVTLKLNEREISIQSAATVQFDEVLLSRSNKIMSTHAEELSASIPLRERLENNEITFSSLALAGEKQPWRIL